jgi:alpha-beta hydrolase superfamily lysophospholipase
MQQDLSVVLVPNLDLECQIALAEIRVKIATFYVDAWLRFYPTTLRSTPNSTLIER